MLHFLGIGAQKAGTTWLYQMLQQHPDLGFPYGKEVHFWNRDYPSKSIDDYLKPFSGLKTCNGEITPAYGHLPLSTIKTIHELLPDLKLIYIVRNPVERAWSSALMALSRAEMEFSEASHQWFIDHFHSQGSLKRGNYRRAIENWLQYYDRDQLLVLRYEDIATYPIQVLQTCCQYLGVSYFTQDLLGIIQPKKKVFKNPKSQPLPSELRLVLEELYREKSLWPVDFTGIDVFKPE